MPCAAEQEGEEEGEEAHSSSGSSHCDAAGKQPWRQQRLYVRVVRVPWAVGVTSGKPDGCYSAGDKHAGGEPQREIRALPMRRRDAWTAAGDATDNRDDSQPRVPPHEGSARRGRVRNESAAADAVNAGEHQEAERQRVQLEPVGSA